MLSALQRVLTTALWLCLVFYGLRTVHEFYQYVDTAIYLAVDDSEANVSYALATEGRYGFLASPVLVGLPRNDGQFNYGPWYFYLGSLLIWLFGYSLSLIRSIHLFVILGLVVGATWWFRGAHGAVAAAVFGFGVLYCFAVAQWPMARPDPLVSAFAVVLVVAAGAAMRRPRALTWGIAALAAGCGALSHLIAWSLVPVAMGLFAVSAVWQWRQRGGEARAPVVRQAVAFATGGVAAAVMFYASFGFDIARQRQFLGAYQDVTASQESYGAILARHWNLAYTYLPEGWRIAPLVVLLAAGAVLTALLRVAPDERRELTALLLPPVAVWAGYTLSLGSFSNFHLGYTILNQVFAWWTFAALLWIGLQMLHRRRPETARAVTSVVAFVVLLVAVGLSVADAGPARDKLLRAREWVPIEDYTEQVLDQVPARATAWGTIVYGIENPDRIQLVQLADALMLTRHMPPSVREPFAPAYLVWGYPENRDSTLSTIRAGEDLLGQFAGRFPSASYVTSALIAAAPYGATRIYARVNPERAQSLRRPAVRVFDPLTRRWRSHVGPVIPLQFAPRPAAALRLGYSEAAPQRVATSAMSASAPPGVYMVRAQVAPGGGDGPRMIAVTSEAQLVQVIGELGPEGAFAPYLAKDAFVDLLHLHPGGEMIVSQFAPSGVGALGAIEVYPVQHEVDDRDAPTAAQFEPVAPDAWSPIVESGVKLLSADNGVVHIQGDRTQYGYQVLGPKTTAKPGSVVTARVALTQESGRVCVGVLNATEQAWVVGPTQALPEYVFSTDRTGGFRLAVANCNRDAAGNAVSQFRIDQASIAVQEPDFYADKLTAAGQQFRTGGQ
jgi:hypothetical protein